jgi:hypothetical protein
VADLTQDGHGAPPRQEMAIPLTIGNFPFVVVATNTGWAAGDGIADASHGRAGDEVSGCEVALQ